jgi:hypothetical protein
VVAKGLMLDNFLPFPDAESLPFCCMVSTLACVGDLLKQLMGQEFIQLVKEIFRDREMDVESDGPPLQPNKCCGQSGLGQFNYVCA